MDGLAKWWAIGLLPAALVAVWWLWWKLPKREVAKLRDSIPDPKDRVDVEDTLRKTISQALGGIVVLIGAGVALAQFLEQRDTAQKQLQASHDLLVSNQIAKGFEQLGSDKIEVRLGGIYALEGILHMQPPDNTSSPDYRHPVLEALCAFVREHTIGKTVQEHPTTDVVQTVLMGKTPKEHPTTDVQAALTVIERRPEELSVNLSGAVVPGAVLPSSNLSGVNLLGANLSGANLDYANLSRVNLVYANLSGAILLQANLSGADLTNASLSGAILFDANLSGASLGDAILSGANMSVANMSGAHLDRANLNGADLHGAELRGADLSDADLSDADLSRVKLDNQEQLSRACGKPKVLPEGFTLDRPCPPKNPK
jgi:uncharacterized protein YjbI with pentapeptide repeats